MEELRARPVTELVVATNFSFLRGGSHAEELVHEAARLGLNGIAVADRNTLSGVVRAHAAAKEIGFPFFVGCRLAFRDGTPDVIAWPTDRAAFGRLCRLLTLGNRRAIKGECDLDLADLLEFGTGLMLGMMPGSSDPSVTLQTLREAFPNAVRLLASVAYGANDKRRLAKLHRIAKNAGVPLMATNDVLYHAPERRPLQDVITCIREHTTLAAAGHRLAANSERHIKPPAEMARLFADYPEALAETQRVKERLAFNLGELEYVYPSEPIGDAASPGEALAKLAQEGARFRYPDGVPAQVVKQLAHELQVIAEKKYEPYFLTVHDIVRFARQEKILCQGRGSAANSVVCYCLGITEVDPNYAKLLFERFISPNRNEPPDIDVDFEHERREEVMQYIYKKYTRDRAGIAATVITYRTRSAIRDVGKAFGLSEDAVGALASTTWGWSSEGVRENDVRRAGLDPSDPTLTRALDLTRELIGFPRHLSQHVGGFVMTRDRLDESVPIMNAAMPDRTHVEWDKDDLDELGMMKVDVLALGMLTCIRRAFEFLKLHYDRELTLATIPKEEGKDSPVYRMLGRADSIGVFQVESRAQMSMLPRLRPEKFYDLVIEVAIVRPGPIQGDMVHPYLRRRQKLEDVEYPSPSSAHGKPDELKSILERTLGVPLFQEQAMKIAMDAAKFSASEADGLRRAMATFRRNGTIGQYKDLMIERMTARGYERDFAERCFHQIEGFGDYGFPESHAASFALLVYASSWLKCHYPDVFCAALLNSQPMGFYAPAQIVRDAERHGVVVLAPDVNVSDWDSALEPINPPPFTGEEDREAVEGAGARAQPHPEDAPSKAQGALETSSSTPRPLHRFAVPLPRFAGEDKRAPFKGRLHATHADMAGDIWTNRAVRLGLRQIKGMATADADKVKENRGAGYDSVRDLWLRTGLPRAAIERLADADAFRSLGLDRRDALWAARGLGNSSRTLERLPLFDVPEHADIRQEPDFALPRMPLGEHVVNDYRYLSLSLKAHPIAFLRERLTARRIVNHGTLRTTQNGRRVTVAGLVLIRQRPGTANGVIFMTLEDETDIANIIVWPRTFETYRPVVLGARLVSVTGKVQSQSGVTHVVAERLDDLTDLLAVLSDAGTEDISTLSRADEVKRNPGVDPRDKARIGNHLMRHPRNEPVGRDLAAIADATHEVMPKGRNFH